MRQGYSEIARAHAHTHTHTHTHAHLAPRVKTISSREALMKLRCAPARANARRHEHGHAFGERWDAPMVKKQQIGQKTVKW